MLKDILSNIFQQCFQSWKSITAKCIRSKGDYINFVSLVDEAVLKYISENLFARSCIIKSEEKMNPFPFDVC